MLLYVGFKAPNRNNVMSTSPMQFMLQYMYSEHLIRYLLNYFFILFQTIYFSNFIGLYSIERQEELDRDERERLYG